MSRRISVGSSKEGIYAITILTELTLLHRSEMTALDGAQQLKQAYLTCSNETIHRRRGSLEAPAGHGVRTAEIAVNPTAQDTRSTNVMAASQLLMHEHREKGTSWKVPATPPPSPVFGDTFDDFGGIPGEVTKQHNR